MIEIIGRNLTNRRAAYLASLWMADGLDTWTSSHHEVRDAGGYDVSVDTDGTAQVVRALFALLATQAELDRFPYGPSAEEAAAWVAAKMGEFLSATPYSVPVRTPDPGATVVMQKVADVPRLGTFGGFGAHRPE
jgi:hypothetical protein